MASFWKSEGFVHKVLPDMTIVNGQNIQKRHFQWFWFCNFGSFHHFFVLSKLTFLVALFDLKLIFKTRRNWPFLAFFINFGPLKIVNVARNVEWDFFWDFKTLRSCTYILGRQKLDGVCSWFDYGLNRVWLVLAVPWSS